ncbi:type IV toxin-antitoxin system AbiEi family antitoxin domain-containing protein [Conexibacter sp. JD483]|uniref:type IV toxin-antitoxin system AbiEi family antitoxin domain-containing protein n=1 Tax=unclassified Conexibacter TaxID=2627773 RepID=UPI00272294AE|nr:MULTISPECIES: type IV toxin-antitoxin system AbiEi family antitoxin domain-containing protein [unclassified Conexibacter]MDO8188174.1 type IV toxin-antitoxin system AbiEi family antitoxin domain-containing protein [Conexibacter sp. CPCC 205706]MDO8201581.1 type IV toxin-antitoxin system AbiEi family antitoxin domain-containing protein [Conexibacter sp. CPCC 205762]MDR9373002.1 type IV toxin-antitoxin system AbiEi family antitoxin domain-containing protein [Conexibacter sp. JD483]
MARFDPDPREVTGPTDQQLHGDQRLARLADRQHGVVARRQLGAIGLSPTMLRDRLERGRLVKLHRGVYAVGHRRLGPRGREVAALFAAGSGAVLSHRNAATLHDLRPGGHRDVDVTVAHQRRAQPGIRLHRAELPDEDVTRIERLPVTTLARTLVDIAATLPRDHVVKAMQEAERARRLDTRAVERVLQRTAHRNDGGHALMRDLLADLRAHETQLTRSKLENRFTALARDFALPRPRTNVHVHGREVDAWWPAAGIAVELDGWRDHGTRRAFQRDREKGNWLALRGVVLLRFTHDDLVRRPAHVAEQLRPALARAAAA